MIVYSWALILSGNQPLKNIRVVLTRPSHPGNIGARARAMKTMGLDAEYMVQPREFRDKRRQRAGRETRDVLQNAQVSDTLADVLRGCVFAVATSSRRRNCVIDDDCTTGSSNAAARGTRASAVR